MTVWADSNHTAPAVDLSDQLIRHIFLEPTVDGAVSKAKYWYVSGKIGVEELELVLDAVLLKKGVEHAVTCPRCGRRVYGIGPADNGLIAVRCTNYATCGFVGYTE